MQRKMLSAAAADVPGALRVYRPLRPSDVSKSLKREEVGRSTEGRGAAGDRPIWVPIPAHFTATHQVYLFWPEDAKYYRAVVEEV